MGEKYIPPPPPLVSFPADFSPSVEGFSSIICLGRLGQILDCLGVTGQFLYEVAREPVNPTVEFSSTG